MRSRALRNGYKNAHGAEAGNGPRTWWRGSRSGGAIRGDHAVLGETEDRTDFVRTAVEKELALREAEAKKRKRS